MDRPPNGTDHGGRMSTTAKTDVNGDESAVGESPGDVTAPLTRRNVRMAAILGSHSLVDIYSAFVPALLGLLEVRCGLSMQQSATLLGVGSICSGLAQPLAAWFNDRFDSRATAACGLLGCAACLSSIGWVSRFSTLIVLYAFGMFASGAFHPAAAATMGHLGGRRRSLGVSLFFVAGMIGWGFGNVMAPRLVGQLHGFHWLTLCMVPGLAAAVGLQFAIRRVPHRVANHGRVDLVPPNVGQRWMMVALLFLASAIRFSVNMALMFLCVRYIHGLSAGMHDGWTAEQIAVESAPLVGNLNAMMIVGMGCGGLLAGIILPQGREKWPMVLLPIVVSPAVYFLPRFGLNAAYLLSAIAGFGFASMVPISMAVAQRLLPHRTSMASALTLGGAWAMAFVGPQFARWSLERFGLVDTYSWVALALVVSGLVILPLRSSLVRESNVS